MKQENGDRDKSQDFVVLVNSICKQVMEHDLHLSEGNRDTIEGKDPGKYRRSGERTNESLQTGDRMTGCMFHRWHTYWESLRCARRRNAACLTLQH